MFDSLAEKLQATLADVRGRGTLTEDDINAAMREIRLALLEADVNFKVVKRFTNAVKERALGSDVIGQLNPGQQVVKIVNDELSALMGGESAELKFSSSPPTVILMAGLQGSGKTTATAKLARLPARAAQIVGRGRGLRRLPPGRRRPAGHGRRDRPAPRSTREAPTPTRSRSRSGRSTARRARARTSSSSTPPAVSTSTRT